MKLRSGVGAKNRAIGSCRLQRPTTSRLKRYFSTLGPTKGSKSAAEVKTELYIIGPSNLCDSFKNPSSTKTRGHMKKTSMQDVIADIYQA
jgi:hypothetical protein